MAKILSIVDDIDGVDESIRDFYAEENGVYVLQIDNFGKHPGVQTLKTAADKHKRDKTELAEKLTAVEKRLEGLPEDFDSEAFETLKQAAEGKGGQPTDEQINQIREKVREKLESKFNEQIAEREQRIEKQQAAIQRMTVDDGLARAMDVANIDAQHKSKLLPYLKSTAKIEVEETEDGAFKAFAETDMGRVDLNKFVSDFAGSDDGKPYVAKSTGPNARGGANGGGSAKSITRSQYNEMSPNEQHETAMKASKGEISIVDDAA